MKALLLGALQIMVLILGFGLMVSTKPVFLVSLGVLGLLVGAMVGMFLSNQSEPDLYIMAGPVLSGLVAFFLALALNVLISDDGIAPRWLLVAALLGTAPGTLIGWVLGRNTVPTAGRQRRADARLDAHPLSPRHPLPPRLPAASPAVPPSGQGALAREARELERYGRVVVQPIENQQTALVVERSHGPELLTIYIVCPPSYPATPPQVMAEISRPGTPGYQPVQLAVRSPSLARWTGQPGLAQVVNEFLAMV